MSARSRMTMRAFIERDGESDLDADRNPVAPIFATLATAPCYAWTKVRKEVVDGDKTIVFDDLRMMVPLSQDVTEADQVLKIEDRSGTTLFPGPMRIESVQRMPTHQEVMLELIT